MTSIGYVILGILSGIAIILMLVVGAWLIYVLHKTAGHVQEAVKALGRAANVFEKSSDMSAHMVSLVGVTRRQISSIESMTAAVKVFTGLVLRDEGEAPPTPPQPAASSRWPGAPPPPMPHFDQYASAEDTGVISQDEEDFDELERQAILREQGVETDPLRIQLPTPDQINMSEA